MTFSTITPEILLGVVSLIFITVSVVFFAYFQRNQEHSRSELSRLQEKLQAQQQSSQALLQESLSLLRTELSQTMNNSGTDFRQQMQNLSQQLNSRMQETNQSLQKTQTAVGDRLDNATKIVSSLQHKLGDLEASNRQIVDVGKGIKDLKDIFKSPKLRGNMGEFFLEDLLRQILPANSYSFQHHFQTGDAVDAVIRVSDSIVSIDSKFPLESFQRMLKTQDNQPENKQKERKTFIQAIKKHADSISKKYILPNEGTFDFAFMYIPAENVYYEIIIRNDISDNESSLYSWLLDRKVIPVSPNSLYAYLQVVILGFKGMRIQEDAKQILKSLDRLQNELDRFRSDHTVLGKHIRNASNSFDNTNRRLEKFQDRYSQLISMENTVSPMSQTNELEKTPEEPAANASSHSSLL